MPSPRKPYFIAATPFSAVRAKYDEDLEKSGPTEGKGIPATDGWLGPSKPQLRQTDALTPRYRNPKEIASNRHDERFVGCRFPKAKAVGPCQALNTCARPATVMRTVLPGAGECMPEA